MRRSRLTCPPAAIASGMVFGEAMHRRKTLLHGIRSFALTILNIPVYSRCSRANRNSR